MKRRSVVPISFLVNLKREMNKFPLFRATLAIYRSWVTTNRDGVEFVWERGRTRGTLTSHNCAAVDGWPMSAGV